MLNAPVSRNNVEVAHYLDPLAVRKMSDNIIIHFPRTFSNVIVLCIGTDRSTGDALGPLTGSFLSKFNLRAIKVVGTLHDPVHAVNLAASISEINENYDNPFIIAIDASLGKATSIGNLMNGAGPLMPGAALQKNLPPVGNIYLTGVVNIGGYMEFAILQSTRLAIVHDMAYKLALTLHQVDKWLTSYMLNLNKTASQDI